MKRSLGDIQRDERARQEDDLLRIQIEREEANEVVRKKRKLKEDLFLRNGTGICRRGTR
jgi:hypothetical protein